MLVSVPGDPEVRMECLPGSTLPDELRNAGYNVRDFGDGERILATAITERFTVNAAGEFEPLTQGSTKPIASTVTHAGIVKVKRHGFDISLPALAPLSYLQNPIGRLISKKFRFSFWVRRRADGTSDDCFGCAS